MKYPHLFEPIKVAGTVFRNRIFASPEGYYNTGLDRMPTPQGAAFFGRKALGGFASVCVGDCIVHTDTGTHYPFLIKMQEGDMLPGLASVAHAIKRHGAVASAELSHAGMYAQFLPAMGKQLYGPVTIENGKYGFVQEMPEELIEEIIGAFGAAAAFAKSAGFGMVTVHGGHGWLLPQFMSSKVNTRTDKWGGSLENRMRMPLAVVESIRKAVGPNFPIEFRMSGSECCDIGYDLDEGIEIAKALDGKVDIIHVSAGHHEDINGTVITHPGMFSEDGCNAYLAREIKKHVKSHVATVGAFTDPAHMEEVIASGGADIVEVGRQSLADPDFPIKARRGMDEDINKCMRCNSCFGSTGKYRNVQCAINPEIGHELEIAQTAKNKYNRKVLIAGGGVAGMQAALTAADRGHKVILCEKTDKLGGVLLCEDNVPFKRRLREYLARQARRVNEDANIEVRLNTEVTPEYAKEVKPEVIIAAMGARPVTPPIPGIENAIGAEDLYYNPEKCGKKLVILGGGLVGIELGIFQAQKGVEVTIVEMMEKLNLDDKSMHTFSTFGEIRKQGIKTFTSTKALNIEKDGVTVENADGTFKLDADTIVYATGQKSLSEEAWALNDCADELYVIGDCVNPENIMAATQAAYNIALDIGRM